MATTQTTTSKRTKANGSTPLPVDSDSVAGLDNPATQIPSAAPTQDKPPAVSPPKFAIMELPIVNIPGSPLVIHAFSQKARDQMKAAQEAGAQRTKKKGNREPKDFALAYHNARHISADGWDGAAAATFRNAAIDACRLVGFHMTVAKRALFIEPDGLSVPDGTPLVRIEGKPYAFEATVRNQTGVADVRVRPRWDDWKAIVRIRFDTELFTPDDLVNLMLRAGEQCGVCEGRPGSKSSFGQGWGMFQVDLNVSGRPLAHHRPDVRRARHLPV